MKKPLINQSVFLFVLWPINEQFEGLQLPQKKMSRAEPTYSTEIKRNTIQIDNVVYNQIIYKLTQLVRDKDQIRWKLYNYKATSNGLTFCSYDLTCDKLWMVTDYTWQFVVDSKPLGIALIKGREWQ